MKELPTSSLTKANLCVFYYLAVAEDAVIVRDVFPLEKSQFDSAHGQFRDLDCGEL